MARRHELSDAQWTLIEGLMPQGGAWGDHRTVVNGMFWKLCSGAAWRDLPERYGPWRTVYARFRRWSKEGLFERVLRRLRLRLAADGNLDYSTWLVDSTSVRATKAAAGAKRGGGGERALGYSRGGFGTKLHLGCDAHGLPLAALLSEGQRHESRYLEALVEAAATETGTMPSRLSGDRAYSAPRIRDWLFERGVEAVIPHRRDELARMAEPPAFDAVAYRGRNAVERLVGWLKEARAVATRSDKLAQSYLGMVHLAMIRLFLRKIAR